TPTSPSGRYPPPLGKSAAGAPARPLPPRDFRAAARASARKGARDIPPLSQGGLHDRDRILARTPRRSHRIHHAPASERGLISVSSSYSVVPACAGTP